MTDAGSQFVGEYIKSIFEVEERIWYAWPKEERMMFVRLIQRYNERMKEELRKQQKC